jgi:hypothetical protein
MSVVDDAPQCPSCGLPQDGPIPNRLRSVVSRLGVIPHEEQRLATERALLGNERIDLLRQLRAPQLAPPPPAVAAVRGEWRPEGVRDLLLWLGAALLALSAITFSVLAWSRLGNPGRFAMLLGATAIGGVAVVALRRRLPASAEAVNALTLVLVLVDWFAARRAGVASGSDPAAWWAGGTALAAAIAAGGATGLRLRSGRWAAVLLGESSAFLLVAASAHAQWTAALGFAIVAAAGAALASLLDRSSEWRTAAGVAANGAGFVEVVALAFAVAAVVADRPANAAGPALAVAMLGAAPALAVVLAQRLHEHSSVNPLIGAVTLAVIGSLVTLGSPEWSVGVILAVTTGLGAGAIAVGRVAARRLRDGIAGAGIAAAGLGVLAVAPLSLRAWATGWQWAKHPWSGELAARAGSPLGQAGATFVVRAGWPVVATLLLGVAAAAIAVVLPRVRPPVMALRTSAVVVVTAGVLAIAVVPLAASLSVGETVGFLTAAVVVLFAVVAALGRRRPALAAWAAVAGALVASPAIGWSLADRGTTLAVVGIVAGVAALAAWNAENAELRATLAALSSAAVIAEAGIIVAAAGYAAGPAGVAVTVAAGAMLVAGALVRRDALDGMMLEGVGWAGLLIGAGLGSASQPWLAVSLTLAVPAIGCAALRPGRDAYPMLAGATAVAATWAWLAAANVTLLEAYTLPAAAVVLALAALHYRSRPEVRSWPAYGAGLAIALGPSTVAAVSQSGVVRPVVLTIAAVVCVLVGAVRRLRAPMELGAATLLVLGIDNVGPVVAQLPRWITLGVAGLLLLWLGATAERRTAQVQGLRHGLAGFD